MFTNPYKFSAYVSTGYGGFPSGAFTKVALNAELFDTGNNFDSTTNNRFTTPVNGFYMLSGSVQFSVLANTHCAMTLFKNGSELMRGAEGTSQNITSNWQGSGGGLVQLVAGDYIELLAYQSQGAAATVGGGSSSTYLTGFLVSVS